MLLQNGSGRYCTEKGGKGISTVRESRPSIFRLNVERFRDAQYLHMRMMF